MLSEMIMGTFKTWVIVVLFIKLQVCRDAGFVLKAHKCSGLGLVQISQMQCYVKNFGLFTTDVFFTKNISTVALP